MTKHATLYHGNVEGEARRSPVMEGSRGHPPTTTGMSHRVNNAGPNRSETGSSRRSSHRRRNLAHTLKHLDNLDTASVFSSAFGCHTSVESPLDGLDVEGSPTRRHVSSPFQVKATRQEASHAGGETPPQLRQSSYMKTPFCSSVQGSPTNASVAAAVAEANKKLRKKLLRRQQQQLNSSASSIRQACFGGDFGATVENLASRANRCRRRSDVCVDEDEEQDDLPQQRSHRRGHREVEEDEFASEDWRRVPQRGAPQEQTSSPQDTSSYFISPIHQSVAESSAPWAGHGTPFRFLGHGGMSSGEAREGSPTDRQRRKRRTRNGTPSTSYRAIYYDEATGTEVDLGGNDSGSISSSSTRSGGVKRTRRKRVAWSASSSSDDGSYRRRHKRRRTSEICGGSQMLRPADSPLLLGTLTMLPASHTDLRQDLLESFLLEVNIE